MSNQERLSIEDISRLAEDKSPNARIEVANKLAKQYRNKDFPPEQLKLAEQIFRLLLRDVEVHVRKAISDNLKDLKDVPRDVILQLTKDVKEVSIPVLEVSEVLTDTDLISIIQTTNEVASQIAISKRKNVSSKVD